MRIQLIRPLPRTQPGGPPVYLTRRPAARLSVLATVFLLIASVTTNARDIIHKGDIVVVPLSGEVSPSLLMFLRREVKAAESSGAGAIILEMNTYGGRLDSAEEMTSVLNHATIPTYTFINSNAGSAGALIEIGRASCRERVALS